MWHCVWGKPKDDGTLAWEAYVVDGPKCDLPDIDGLIVAVLFREKYQSSFLLADTARRLLHNTASQWISAKHSEWQIDLRGLRNAFDDQRPGFVALEGAHWLTGKFSTCPEVIPQRLISVSLNQKPLPGFGGAYEVAFGVFMTQEMVGTTDEVILRDGSWFGDRWEIVDDVNNPLGKGGGGSVHLVRDISRVTSRDGIYQLIIDAVREASLQSTRSEREDGAKSLIAAIGEYVASEKTENLAAIKLLHTNDGARDPVNAATRMRQEIEVMAKLKHPHLLRIIDHFSDDDRQLWFVSEYHPNGTLQDHQHAYTANVAKALRDLRPVIDAVALLHAQKPRIVHRDVKPQNIYLSTDGDLILGDFGLVSVVRNDGPRMTATEDNTGSWDWMPDWQQGYRREEEVNPSFDVFTLGKVLWWMVIGQPVNRLRNWYIEEQGYDNINVEKAFPDAPHVGLFMNLLRKCVVQHEAQCLTDASELRDEVDQCLRIIENEGDLLDDAVKRTCKVCGRGTFEQLTDQNDLNSIGVHSISGRMSWAERCNACGFVQTFVK